MKAMLLILMALFASCAVLTAQDARQADSSQAKTGEQRSQPARNQKTAAKTALAPQLQDATAPGTPVTSRGPLLLKGAGPANVEDAARRAAHDLAAGQKEPSTKSGGMTKDAPKIGKDSSSSSAPSGIGEFQAVPGGTSRTSAGPVVQKSSSAAKRIHGEIYGAGGTAGRAGSESVGATSRSGKTSVYVQSDQAAPSAAPPK
ncbi:MAG TPA: hypothetical protein VGZ29_15195 [Terriglobia bacterium]|nr:hypothetical protein [Terriglobia bacterium]